MAIKASDTYYARNRQAILARRKEHRAARREHYREKGREQMRRWRATHPRYSPHHGLSPEQVAEKLAEQGGVCAICRLVGRRWHGDHDHQTGRFRAVLCTKCNMGLGLLNDDPARCRAAADYLEKHAREALW